MLNHLTGQMWSTRLAYTPKEKGGQNQPPVSFYDILKNQLLNCLLRSLLIRSKPDIYYDYMLILLLIFILTH